MSTSSRNISASDSRRQSSRLQRRAPASIQISPVSEWNVAIPLLSPLASSPPSSSGNWIERTEDAKKLREEKQTTPEKAPVFKKWQHPAAPFYYETPSFGSSMFVPVSNN